MLHCAHTQELALPSAEQAPEQTLCPHHLRAQAQGGLEPLFPGGEATCSGMVPMDTAHPPARPPRGTRVRGRASSEPQSNPGHTARPAPDRCSPGTAGSERALPTGHQAEVGAGVGGGHTFNPDSVSVNLVLKKHPNNKGLVLPDAHSQTRGVLGARLCPCLTLQRMAGLCPLSRRWDTLPCSFLCSSWKHGALQGLHSPGASWNPWVQCGPLTRASKAPLVPIRPAPQTAWRPRVVLQGAVLASWRSPGAEAQPSDITLGFWDALLESRGPGRNKPHSAL